MWGGTWRPACTQASTHSSAFPIQVCGKPSSSVSTHSFRRGKMTPKTALGHPHKAPPEVKKLFDTIDGQPKRYELNLYVSGYEDEPEPREQGAADREPPTEQSAPETEGQS